MATVEIPIGGGYGKADPSQASPADLLNMYTIGTHDGKNKLFITPGLDSSNGINFGGAGGIRNTYISRLIDNVQVIVGSRIVQVDPGLNIIPGIEITTSNGYVGIDDTKTDIVFVDGVKGYRYNKATNIYSELNIAGFPSLPQDVAAYGDRFYVIKGNTNEIYYSGIDDATDWNTLNRIDITTYPDDAIALHVLRGRLYVFGRRVTEVWVLQGGAVPVARDESLVLEYGVVNPGVIASEGGIMTWIGYDKQGITSVVATEGGSPRRISTPDVEKEFQAYDVVTDARAFMYIENGHLFYQINFTNADKSWLYCFNSNTWSRLSYKDNNRHRAQTHVFFNGKKYVGDYALPILYDFNNAYFSDDGVGIKRKWVSNIIIPNNGDPFSVHQIRFYVQQGVGTETGKDEEPALLLRISRDSGVTFDDQMSSYIGQLGLTDAHTEFYRIGYSEYGSIVLEVEYYHQTNFGIMNCFMEITV